MCFPILSAVLFGASDVYIFFSTNENLLEKLNIFTNFLIFNINIDY